MKSRENTREVIKAFENGLPLVDVASDYQTLHRYMVCYIQSEYQLYIPESLTKGVISKTRVHIDTDRGREKIGILVPYEDGLYFSRSYKERLWESQKILRLQIEEYVRENGLYNDDYLDEVRSWGVEDLVEISELRNELLWKSAKVFSEDYIGESGLEAKKRPPLRDSWRDCPAEVAKRLVQKQKRG